MSVNVVILVAGVGSRLMPLTRNTPKSLIDVGDGFTLLERQLESIAACGVRDITLVTGYKSEQIEAKIKDYAEFDFEIVFNPFYRMANNIASAWMGMKDRATPTVVINGDDLFKPNVLAALLETPHEITLMVSRKDAYDDDDMKVVLDGDRILDVGKDIDLTRANGESIGMMLFQGRGLTTIQECLLDMVRREEHLQLFYLAALRRLMQEGTIVHGCECSGEDWAEVDFHPDLMQIRDQLASTLPHWDRGRTGAPGGTSGGAGSPQAVKR